MLRSDVERFTLRILKRFPAFADAPRALDGTISRWWTRIGQHAAKRGRVLFRIAVATLARWLAADHPKIEARVRARLEDEAQAMRVVARRDEVKPPRAQPCNDPRDPEEPMPRPRHVPDVVTLYPHGPAAEKAPDPPRALPMHVRPGTEDTIRSRLARWLAGDVPENAEAMATKAAVLRSSRVGPVRGAAPEAIQ